MIKALPESQAPTLSVKDPIPCSLRLYEVGSDQFTKDLLRQLYLRTVSELGDALFPALVQKPRPRLGRFSSGTCTCSRRALIIARCPHCARADLALAAEEAAEEEGEDPDPMEGALVASVPGSTEHIGGVKCLPRQSSWKASLPDTARRNRPLVVSCSSRRS